MGSERNTYVSKFLDWFSPISLQYKEPERSYNPWVFWRQNEGSEINNNSSSAAAAADLEIHDKIKSVFSNIKYGWAPLFGQFWAPVTIDGRQLLSAFGQPFAVWGYLCNEMAKYRLYTEKHKYNIDINYKPADIEEEDHMIISAGPATAFLSRLPYFTHLQWIQAESFRVGGSLNYSVMIPICFPSQSSCICIGVLQFTFQLMACMLGDLVFETIRGLNEAGLDVIRVQDLIPYKTINGLKLAKDHIKEALKVVCESHNLALAQVWVANEDIIRVPSSSSFGGTQTNRLLAIKLTCYHYIVSQNYYDDLVTYFRICDVIPCGIWPHELAELAGVELPLETLQDCGSRYISDLHSAMLLELEEDSPQSSAFAICLRSNDTGDFNYVLEFVWTNQSNYVNHLEAIILTLKRCLPRFKFASGAELGEELDVIVVESATESEADEDNETGETKRFKIFQEKRSIPMPKAHGDGKKPTVVDSITPSEVTCKTTPKVLSREAIENQFGKTMKEAAKNLKVSLSTLKRKFKKLGIPEWPGPVKRKANDSSIIQIDTHEEDNGAIQEPSTINIDQNILTIKAELSDDMIKFHLPISQATFATIEKEIGRKLKLSVGTYKLKYLDEDGDWILLTSNEEMRDCIKSLRKSYRTVVKIRVLPTPQPISGHSGIFGM